MLVAIAIRHSMIKIVLATVDDKIMATAKKIKAITKNAIVMPFHVLFRTSY